MKYTIGAFLIFAIITSGVYSQNSDYNIQIISGAKRDINSRFSINQIVSTDATGFNILLTEKISADKENKILEHFNTDMNPDFRRQIDLSYPERLQFENYRRIRNDRNMEFVVEFQEVLYLFTSYKLDKIKHNYLFAETINKMFLIQNDDAIQVCDIDYNSDFDYGYFYYSLSNDGSKLLICKTIIDASEKVEKVGYYIFGEGLSIIWKKEFTIPYDSDLPYLRDFSVDNNGNAYIISLSNEDKSLKKAIETPRNEFNGIAFTDYGNKSSEFTFGLANKYITDFYFGSSIDLQTKIQTKDTINDDYDETPKNLYCSGFFSDKSTYSIKGSFFIDIDFSSLKIVKTEISNFDEEFLKLFINERQAVKEKELVDFEIDTAIVNNKTITLIAEQKSTELHNQEEYYSYNNVIIARFSPIKGLSWTQGITKYQNENKNPPRHCSYGVLNYNTDFHIIFNDHPNNLYRNNTKRLFSFDRFKESQLLYIKADKEGKTQSGSIFQTMNSYDEKPCPSVSRQISENEIIMMSESSKAYKFIKIIFNK